MLWIPLHAYRSNRIYLNSAVPQWTRMCVYMDFLEFNSIQWCPMKPMEQSCGCRWNMLNITELHSSSMIVIACQWHALNPYGIVWTPLTPTPFKWRPWSFSAIYWTSLNASVCQCKQYNVNTAPSNATEIQWTPMNSIMNFDWIHRMSIEPIEFQWKSISANSHSLVLMQWR